MSTEEYAAAVAESMNAPGPSKPNRRGAGRKSKEESRAEEFRHRLTIWRQLQESSRPPLRALARELGTTHQMLAHCLDGLEIWQARETQRRTEEECKRRADEIRSRAEAEGRPMTGWELERVTSYGERRWRAGLDAALLDQLWKLKKKAENGPLDPIEIKMLKMYAKNRYPGAPELVQKCSQQKVERKRKGKEDDPEIRLHELLSRFEETGGILLHDDEGQVRYFVQNEDAESRAVLAELWEHRVEVKRIIGEWVKKLVEQGRYEQIKAKICQHFPPSMLSPLDELKDTGENGGNSARTR